MVFVGNYGVSGSMEIQDLLLILQGPTAGAVLMKWNIAEDKQGVAAMWGEPFIVMRPVCTRTLLTHVQMSISALVALRARTCNSLTAPN